MSTASTTMPFKEKLLLYMGYFLFIAAIYILMDLYVPLKKLTLGDSITITETLGYIEIKKKLPLIIIFSFLMARATLKRRARKATVSIPEKK